VTVTLGLIGCGAIGSEVVKAVANGTIRNVGRIVAYDMVREKCLRLAEEHPQILECVDSLRELLSRKPRVVVEAASQEAVKEYGERVLEAGADLVILSVGALLDNELRERLVEAAKASGTKVYVPTGAIAGLDAVRAARLSGITRVELITKKPPKALGLEGLKEPKVLFEGPASEAVRRYPRNVNVVAALTLAAGVEATVKVVADPSVERNTHEIIVESRASRIRVRVENLPSPSNPRTSHLASLSAIELLRKILGGEEVLVGT